MTTCIACEGFPTELNNPCGLCGATTKEASGTSAQSDVDAVREAFREWRGLKAGAIVKPSNHFVAGYQAGLAAREEWISVKERLPTKDVKQVFTLEDNGTIHACEFPSGWEGMLHHDYITHWMLPPIPPKD